MRGLTNLGGGGGLTAEEHEWLESLANYTPNMYDINPLKESTGGATHARVYENNTNEIDVPVCGYAKVAIIVTAGGGGSYRFRFADGSFGESTIIALNTWTDYLSIPANALQLCFTGAGGYPATTMFYSLLTADSPYNPDNQ